MYCYPTYCKDVSYLDRQNWGAVEYTLISYADLTDDESNKIFLTEVKLR